MFFLTGKSPDKVRTFKTNFEKKSGQFAKHLTLCLKFRAVFGILWQYQKKTKKTDDFQKSLEFSTTKKTLQFRLCFEVNNYLKKKELKTCI